MTEQTSKSVSLRRRPRGRQIFVAALSILAVTMTAITAYRGRQAAGPSSSGPRSGHEAAVKHFETGVKWAREGNQAAAGREWQTAIGLDPAFPDPYYAVATADAAAGSYSAAVKRLESLRLANPSAPHIDCPETDRYFRAGRKDTALQMGRIATSHEPGCTLAHSV